MKIISTASCMKNKEYVRLTTSLLKKYMPVFKTHLHSVKVYKIAPKNSFHLNSLVRYDNYVYKLCDINFPEEEYVKGRGNSIACPLGYSKITTAIECENAANFLGITFKEKGSWAGSPKGCIVNTVPKVNFNEQGNRPHPSWAVVCVKGTLFYQIRSHEIWLNKA